MRSIAVLLSLVMCTVALPAPQWTGSGYRDPYGTQLPTFSDLNTNTNSYTDNQMRIYPYVVGPYAYPYYQYYNTFPTSTYGTYDINGFNYGYNNGYNTGYTTNPLFG